MADHYRRYEEGPRRGSPHGWSDRAAEERPSFRDRELRERRGNDEQTEPYRYGGEPGHSWRDQGDGDYERRGGDRGYGGGGYDHPPSEDERWGVGGAGRPRFGVRRDYADQEYGRPYSDTSAWRQRAGTNYAGRGPKDYRRSDERIREDISDRLMDDPDVDASDISVQVQNGEVTLTGTVASRGQKRCAEDCVEHVSGVREVANNLRVSRHDASSGGVS